MCAARTRRRVPILMQIVVGAVNAPHPRLSSRTSRCARQRVAAPIRDPQAAAVVMSTKPTASVPQSAPWGYGSRRSPGRRVWAGLMPHTPLSSPGLTGRSQYSETFVTGSMGRGVLDSPLSRGMTVGTKGDASDVGTVSSIERSSTVSAEMPQPPRRTPQLTNLSRTGSTPTLPPRCGRSLRRSAGRSAARGCSGRCAPPPSA